MVGLRMKIFHACFEVLLFKLHVLQVFLSWILNFNFINNLVLIVRLNLYHNDSVYSDFKPSVHQVSSAIYIHLLIHTEIYRSLVHHTHCCIVDIDLLQQEGFVLCPILFWKSFGFMILYYTCIIDHGYVVNSWNLSNTDHLAHELSKSKCNFSPSKSVCKPNFTIGHVINIPTMQFFTGFSRNKFSVKIFYVIIVWVGLGFLK